MKSIYSIFSEGKDVIFRVPDDYIYMINKLAIYSSAHSIALHAYAVMSTHLHLVVELNGTPNEFIKDLRSQYQRHFASSYGLKGISLNFDFRQLFGRDDIENALSYVLRNPVHHITSSSPFSYPYSSIRCYYPKYMKPTKMYEGEDEELEKIAKSHLQEFSGLTMRQQRAIFGRMSPAKKFLVKDGMVILPESFIETKLVEEIFPTFRSFMYGMTCKKVSSSAESNLAAFRISDIEVCRHIDNWAAEFGLKSFFELSSRQKSDISLQLRAMGAESKQISRCLWLP